MKYKCIKEMHIQKCDGDGYEIPNEYGIVPVGSIWYEDGLTVIGGEVHLECESGSNEMGWIEITKNDLKECFEVIRCDNMEIKI